MEFKEKERISEQLTDYLRTFTSGDEVEQIALKHGLGFNKVKSLMYGITKFKLKYTDVLIDLMRLAMSNYKGHGVTENQIKRTFKSEFKKPY